LEKIKISKLHEFWKISPSKCRGNLGKMGYCTTILPKKPRPLLHARAYKFFVKKGGKEKQKKIQKIGEKEAASAVCCAADRRLLVASRPRPSALDSSLAKFRKNSPA
jgi:hypothetical protein